uniref:4-hydroxybenzoate polyprenyltransferase, mitochondrial n=1 Tax=Compsopogon caeruleus TaxID=31354 RepID=A0A7S1XE92_9RHOD|mmetsp:Transcript_2838/g.5281  ORF Transcript_2838/g.5281 Transcript_2838/m.5281 type:complete len:293 (+) Transcript_2838:718-1596(+)
MRARLAERWLAYRQLMRWDKPAGTWLLYAPCTWSIALATDPGSFPDPWLLGSFGVGAVLLRGAGCTINDWWDRDIDRRVRRSASRPVASGQVSPHEALALAGAQALAGLPILLTLNPHSVTLGAASLVPVALYPLAKRVTMWPQAALGLTFNWGALLGWSATTGTLAAPAWALYSASWAWTMVYDTIYAHQDKDDDANVGVGSTALAFGPWTRPWLVGFTALFCVASSLAGSLVGQTTPFYAGVVVSTGLMLREVIRTDLGNPDDCMRAFQVNTAVGPLMFSGIVVGNLQFL